MSKFFRSPNSSGSDSDSDEEEDLNQSFSRLEVSSTGQQDVSSADTEASTSAVDLPRNRSAQLGREFLIHSLLEERCMNQVLDERRHSGRSTSSTEEIQQEARERYQSLCARLAPMNLVSVGLDDDRHGSTRQTIRDGLDRMASTRSATGLASGRPQASFPAPLRRLITAPDVSKSLPADLHFATMPGTPTSLLNGMISNMPSLMPSRYVQDFEELGVLGKGGFGKVFQVRHKLDNCIYAVKKIPLRPSLIARVASTGGQQALDEMLAEVRSLSKLQHPNVVRYYNSWIEWSTNGGFSSSSSNGFMPPTESPSAVAGAVDFETPDLPSTSLHRVETQSDTVENIGFTFEASNSLQARSESIASVSALQSSSEGISTTFDDDVTDASERGHLSTTEPTLALHMQMSVHPMTLADFLSPPQDTGTVKPLAHCFHLEPSVRILLALLDGVEYLHAEGIVHRDLKPANIFLGHESNPKAAQGCVDLFLCSDCRTNGDANPMILSVCIGDFGLVTQAAQREDTNITTPANAVGTEIYRPTSTKSNVSPCLDIFALGIIACELLCKFDTQMERRETLQLLREGSFPNKFDNCAGHHSSKVEGCIATMLTEDDDYDHSTRIADVRRRLSDILAHI